jgi:hypothetical protein
VFIERQPTSTKGARWDICSQKWDSFTDFVTLNKTGTCDFLRLRANPRGCLHSKITCGHDEKVGHKKIDPHTI